MSKYVKIAPHALVVFGAIAVGSGAVAGYVLNNSAKTGPVVPDAATNAVQRVTVAAPDPLLLTAQADADMLRKRVSELEKLLDEREANIKELMADAQKKPMPDTPPPQEVERRERPSFERIREEREARLERMKTEDPEAYEEEMKRREEWKKRQDEFVARIKAENEERNSFLESIDTANMTPEQKKDHESLIAALAVRDSFGQRMMPGSDNPLSDEERQQFFESMRTIGPLMEKERRYIFETVGKTCGYDGAEFADYVQNVISYTSVFGRGGGPRGGGPRGGGPRGGGPRGGGPGGRGPNGPRGDDAGAQR